MITLFDQEQVWKDYINSLISSDRKEQAMDIAQSMYEDGMPINNIAKYVKTDVSTVEKWLGLKAQSY